MRILRKIKAKFGKRDTIVMDMSCARTIADMQRDLDAYNFAFTNIIGYLNGKFGGKFMPAMPLHTASKDVDEQIKAIFDAAVDLRRKYDELEKAVVGKIDG